MKFLHGHTNESNSYLVEDYPWGFRLRTSQRHWIESKKGHGERHVTQTLNPKNGRWCNPKKSTYSMVVVLFLDDENGYLRGYDYDVRYSDQVNLDKFLSLVGFDNLTEFQQNQIKFARAVLKTREHITVEIKPSPVGPINLMSNDPKEKAKMKAEEERQEAHKIEQAKTNKNIGRLLSHYAGEEGVV